MKSIFTKIVVWSFGTLVLSLLAFVMVTAWITRNSERAAGRMFPRLQSFELAEARSVYETGGSRAVAVFLSRLNNALGKRHYLVDANGKDLATGEDRSPLLTSVAHRWNEPVFSAGGMLIGTISRDGKYCLIGRSVPPPHVDPWRYIPYYGLILFAVAILCWPLAMNIGAPLRTLANVVDRFGQGDLSIRLRLARRDEIGNLARSFDRMADRIETLLIAERRLLQDVSHELRSPLARLSFAAELARTAPDHEVAIARVKKEISRLSELVGTLLEVTRNEGDPSSRSRATFFLDELVRQVVEDCSVENVDRACHFILPAADPVALVGDRELMRRAVENVLRNAIYYSPAESKVEVTVRRVSEHAQISVRDRGPGVPAELLPKIFQPFFRVDDSRNGATGGLGLGLSIALRAVRLHNGEIRAKNANPGLLVEIDLPWGKP
ncbi:MAG: two-component system, OmpR family, sensor histidine kinase CpxA [Bryobacterales bacterium]|jgi:two-component system sensor histidine kinase CpxA|nr:two-component system, OmpR family, sensor histidine kinase CpxA [Bryobacterales bacterium]